MLFSHNWKTSIPKVYHHGNKKTSIGYRHRIHSNAVCRSSCCLNQSPSWNSAQNAHIAKTKTKLSLPIPGYTVIIRHPEGTSISLFHESLPCHHPLYMQQKKHLCEARLASHLQSHQQAFNCSPMRFIQARGAGHRHIHSPPFTSF